MQQTTYKLVTKGKIYFSFIPVKDIHIFFYTYYQFRKFFFPSKYLLPQQYIFQNSINTKYFMSFI